MEAANISETSLHFHQSTWSNVPGGSHFITPCYKNLKSHQVVVTVALYWGGPGFKSESGDFYHDRVFYGFPQSLQVDGRVALRVWP